jgi:hypothetical protein
VARASSPAYTTPVVSRVIDVFALRAGPEIGFVGVPNIHQIVRVVKPNRFYQTDAGH